MHTTNIKLGTISVSPRHRATSTARVKQLADSILEVGLLQPIGVTREHELVYGRHRMEAYRLLGHSEIPAMIVELDDMKSEIAMIDENILRVNLTEAQYGKALKRRKELYEALHPETKHGGKPGRTDGKRGKIKSDKLSSLISFAADTAAKTGTSRRTVERSVALAEKLDDQAVDTLGEHPVANSKTELQKLAELPPSEQRTVASKLASGEAESVSHAVTGKPPRKKPTRKPKANAPKESSQSDDDEAMDAVEDLMRDVFAGRLAVAAARLEALAEKLRKDA
jgi:ParB family chromosome partitioning protein